MSDKTTQRIFEMLDDIKKEIQTLKVGQAEVKTLQKSDREQNHKEHNEFMQEIKALQLRDEFHNDIIAQGKGFKKFAGLLWGLLLALLSGVGVYFVMK